ncbi:hypothetical protein JCM8208_004758, partial [Rhodotorula glutinis]
LEERGWGKTGVSSTDANTASKRDLEERGWGKTGVSSVGTDANQSA